jgi:hypothetical protein
MNHHTILELRRDMVIRVQYRYRSPSQSITNPTLFEVDLLFLSHAACCAKPLQTALLHTVVGSCEVLPTGAPQLYPSLLRSFCSSFDTKA